jgi:NAD(P)-dependent dehydrogenase (short-subunit alcohol dehydrogenase family)
MSFLDSLFDLHGQTAVVIGGTGILGGALCDGLAQAGMFVGVAGRSEPRGKARVAAIEKYGGEAAFLPVDATDRESIEQLLKQIVLLRGQVDVLVNAAGANSATSYLEATDDDWDRVFDANLKSTHTACQIFARDWIDTGRPGSIVNIGSVTAHLPLSRVFAYSASKAAVVNLTQNIARELAPHGIRCNVLCPGFFPAEQNRKILDAERTEQIMHQTPLGRFGKPKELVGALLLLASRTAGSFITGAAFYVDGGFTAMRL